MKTLINKILTIVTMISFIATPPVYSLPSVDEVVNGEADIEYIDENTLQITATDGTIINYSSFDIGLNESVMIILPSVDAQILNNVLGDNATSIMGNLECNGIFILVNPNGVDIASSANIQAAGLILSTNSITNTDFINKDFVFKKLDKDIMTSIITNEGVINIKDGGFGVLIASAIENKGSIIATGGTIALASGDAVSLGISNGGLISVAIDEAVASAILDKNGNPITAQINNLGNIDASVIILDAKSLPDIFQSAINLEGEVVANTVEDINGTITLVSNNSIDIAGAVRALTGDIHIQSTDEGINIQNSAEISSGDITLIAQKDMISEGVLNATKDMTITAGGDVRSTGSLYADTLTEQGASFYVSGESHVGTAFMDNLDNAVTYGTGNYSGDYGDDDNVIIDTGATITLTGDTEFWADNLADGGNGAFIMNSGSSIVGDGLDLWDLTLKATQASGLRSIDIDGTLTIAESQTGSNPTFTAFNNITASQTNLVSGTFSVGSTFTLTGDYVQTGGTFDANNVASDVTFNNSVNMQDGTFESTNLAVTGSFAQSGGTFYGNYGEGYTHTYGGSFNLSGGIYYSAQDFNIAGVYIQSGGDFYATAVTSGVFQNNFNLSNGTFYNLSSTSLTIDGNFSIGSGGGTGTAVFNGSYSDPDNLAIEIGGEFKIEEGANETVTFVQGNSTITLRDDMKFMGDGSPTFTKDEDGLIIFASGADQNLYQGNMDIGNIQISANGTNTNLIIKDNASLNADDITIDNGQTLTLNDAAVSRDLYCGGDYTNNGTLTLGSTTNVIFDGGAGTITTGGTGAGKTFYDVTINSTDTKTLSGNMTIANDLDINSGALNIGTYDVNVSGNATVADATLYIAESSNTGLSTTDLTISADGTVSCSGVSKINVSSDWDSSLGEFTSGESIVNLTGTGTIKINQTPGIPDSFYDLRLAASGETTTMLSNVATFYLTTGDDTGRITDEDNNYFFHVYNGVDGSDIFNYNGAILDIDAILIIPENPNITLNVPSWDYTYSLTGSGLGTLLLEGNTNGMDSVITYDLSGDITTNILTINTNNDIGENNYAIFNTNNHTITATGITLGMNGDPTEYATFNAGSSTIDINGSFYIYESDENGDNIFNADSSTINISGDFYNGDTFNAQTSEVIFDDASQVSHIYGTTFNDLTCTTAGKEIQVQAGATETITGTLTLTGTEGGLITLKSTSDGDVFYIDPQSTVTTSYLYVQDSVNQGNSGDYIDPLFSTNGGNTTLWFSPIPDTDDPDDPDDPWDPDDPNDPWWYESESLFIEYEEGEKYKKHYKPGKYKTSVICYEGRVVAAPYNDDGPLFDEGEVLNAGDSFHVTGVIEA